MLSLIRNNKKHTIEKTKSNYRSVSSMPENSTDAKYFLQKLGIPEPTKLEGYYTKMLSLVAKKKEIVQAAFYIYDKEATPPVLRFLAGYACSADYTKDLTFQSGEGLPGQVIEDKELLNLRNVPEGYINVETGLGQASPCSLLLIPLVQNKKVAGLIELASFHDFTKQDEIFFSEIAEYLARQLIKLVFTND